MPRHLTEAEVRSLSDRELGAIIKSTDRYGRFAQQLALSTFYIKLWDDRASFIPGTDGSGTVESGVWGIVIQATGKPESSQWMFIWDGTFPPIEGR